MARAEDIKKIIDQQKANDEAINPNPTLIGTTSSNATAADNTFLTLALGTVTEAIKADKNNDYEKALALYKDALMKFVQAIKCTSVLLFFYFRVIVALTTTHNR